MKITDILGEAPIQDFKTIGDFDRNSSFRDPKDRAMITNPKAQEVYRKKFSNTDYDFNMYFVNSPAAGRHAEVGEVNMQWVNDNLGEEVAKAINTENEAINIVFTNNKGAQRVNMTPWIMAHRISHVMTRPSSKNYITDSFGMFLRFMAEDVFPLYGINKFPRSYNQFLSNPEAQKILQLFMYATGSFKSARDKKLRNGVEALHELFAQYIISGEVKRPKIPTVFGNRNMSRSLPSDTHDFEMTEYQHYVDNAFDALGDNLEQALGAYIGSILVM